MKKIITTLAIFLALIIPSAVVLQNVLSGNIAFWYDPARDMLMAWNNLSKLTLIGQPSGIPGIFYGPYWIWLLSFGEIFSKDPKIVLLITTTFPYLIIAPFILYQYARKVFDLPTGIVLWLLFSYSSWGIFASLWNPNLSPLLFLGIIYLLVTVRYPVEAKSNLRFFFAGIISGLALNIHISFSTGFILGCLIFLVAVFCFENNKKFRKILILRQALTMAIFLSGILVTFFPFFLFESRHGFFQTKILFRAISQGGNVVSLHGLSQQQILIEYVTKLSGTLFLPIFIALTLFVIFTVIFISAALRGKIFLTVFQKQLILLLCSITLCVLAIYLSAKNPIWSYHFIGVEIIWLLFIGLLVTKIKWLQYVAILYVLYLSTFQMVNFVRSFSINPVSNGSLITKEYIVRRIQQDAKGQAYAVYAYSPSIYIYEYTYLFRWLIGKNIPYDPSLMKKEKLVYLILPHAKQVILNDFITYRTPNYITVETMSIPDGTIIVKRVTK